MTNPSQMVVTPGRMSPETDLEKKFEKKYENQQRRWETVMENKHLVTADKETNRKKQLAKKFKREKEMEKKAKEMDELKTYDEEKRAELVFANMERKKKQDNDLETKKRKEYAASQKKSMLVNQRRHELLVDRSNARGIASSRALPPVNGSQDGNRDSNAAIAPMK